MAGLIQSNLGGAPITPQSIEAQLHLLPQQKQQLQRIVVAGMKVMFSPQTHHLMVQELQAPGPIAQKLGQGIAGLLGLLQQEANNALPKQLLIPAGMVLLTHAADFCRQAGLPITNQDIGNGIQVLVNTILKAAKVDPAKVAATVAKGTPLTKPAAAPVGA